MRSFNGSNALNDGLTPEHDRFGCVRVAIHLSEWTRFLCATGWEPLEHDCPIRPDKDSFLRADLDHTGNIEFIVVAGAEPMQVARWERANRVTPVQVVAKDPKGALSADN
jgi:hypothetical protein